MIVIPTILCDYFNCINMCTYNVCIYSNYYILLFMSNISQAYLCPYFMKKRLYFIYYY